MTTDHTPVAAAATISCTEEQAKVFCKYMERYDSVGWEAKPLPPMLNLGWTAWRVVFVADGNVEDPMSFILSFDPDASIRPQAWNAYMRQIQLAKVYHSAMQKGTITMKAAILKLVNDLEGR